MGRALAAPGEPPAWTKEATSALLKAASRIRLLAGSTPKNLAAELGRLGSRWASGDPDDARFEYDEPPDHSGLCRALVTMANGLEKRGPLGVLFAERAREVALEAALCSAVAGRSFWTLARKRYAARDPFDREADSLADEWLAERPRSNQEVAKSRTDDERDRASLLSRMRQEISVRRLPIRVVVASQLASLAATGDGAVQIAPNREATSVEVERTVLHELDGHVLPRVVASTLSLGIFSVGCARGADDQEGRALALEHEAGYLDGARRHELALRHLAARCVEQKADFVETVRALQRSTDALPVVLRIAARAHRGGGLGRESVYLPAFLRYRAAVQHAPAVETVLRAGRVTVDAVGLLGPWIS